MRARLPTRLELRASMWVLGVAWWSRTRRFADLVARLEAARPRRRPTTGPPGGRQVPSPIAALSAVRRMHRFLPVRRTCLTESLAGLGLLRSLGWPARLRIGVRGPVTPVEAHAWLEVEGRSLDPASSGYTELGRPRGASA